MGPEPRSELNEQSVTRPTPSFYVAFLHSRQCPLLARSSCSGRSVYIWKNPLSTRVALLCSLRFELVSYDVEDATSGSGSFDEGALLSTSFKPLKEARDRVSRTA